MKKSLHSTIAVLALFLALAGCATAPRTRADRDELKASAEDALGKMSAADESLGSFLRGAHGYVIFPKVGKGAYIVGGSYGRGVVYEAGSTVGYADITQATLGFQFGGEAFMEILAFESARDLQRFQSGKLAFSANVSAVILKTGAASSARYTDGVAVFVKPIGGAMVEASFGGQQFTYQPE
jgi:lipid-binding SYLF domain-containing protein